MKIPLITGEAPEGNYPINWYFLPEDINGRNAMVGTPGMKLKYNTGSAYPVRGAWSMNGSLFVVAGNSLYKIPASGQISTVGALKTLSGRVEMKDNGIQLMIIDYTYGYIYESGSLDRIADQDFPTPASLAYQDGYFIVIEDNTENFYISTDGASWNALDFSQADGLPDKARSILMDHRELWIFQDESIRVYYNSGNADFPFDPVPGGFIENGIGAAASPVGMDNSIFWLDDDYIVRRATGLTPTIISPPKINQIISKYSIKTDAFAYKYVMNGCSFYVLSFPSENKTWVYNAATNFWHQWASGVRQLRHRSNCCVRFNGQYLIGDSESGKIFELDNETYTDDGDTIKATRITPPIFHEDRVTLFYGDLEIEFESGVGLVTGQGSDPQCMLSWSDDKGETWSREHWVTIGKMGKYKNKSVWDALGEATERIFKLEITDPVKRTLISANANVSKGIH